MYQVWYLMPCFWSVRACAHLRWKLLHIKPAGHGDFMSVICSIEHLGNGCMPVERIALHLRIFLLVRVRCAAQNNVPAHWSTCFTLPDFFLAWTSLCLLQSWTKALKYEILHPHPAPACSGVVCSARPLLRAQLDSNS